MKMGGDEPENEHEIMYKYSATVVLLTHLFLLGAGLKDVFV